jgi:hypothetical protein
MKHKFAPLIFLLMVTLTSLACIPCGLLGGGKEEAAQPPLPGTVAVTEKVATEAGAIEKAEATPEAAQETVAETEEAAADTSASDVTLGEEYRSEEGGFAFLTIPDYVVEGEPGFIGMNAPDADPDIGPSIMFMGYTGEDGATSEQMLAEWRQDMEADFGMTDERKVTVDSVTGLAVDISGTDDNGRAVAGRLVVVAVPPAQQFVMLGAAPGERWDDELAPLFDAVVTSVTFFEPGSPSAESEEAGVSASDSLTSQGGELRQWAASATASSEYGRHSRTASEATGAPNTFECGEMNTAWQSEGSDTVEWLELYYDTAVRPTEVNVIQTNSPNQILFIDLIDPAGEYHEIYLGEPEAIDECPYTLSIPIENADYLAVGLKMVIDQSELIDWNAIDAVELVGYAEQAGEAATSSGESQTGTEGGAENSGDIPAGGFYFEVSGEKQAQISGPAQEHSSSHEYGIAMVEQGAAAQYSVTIYLPHDVAPGQIEMKPFDKSALAYGPSAAAYAGGIWFYYADSGTITVESVSGDTITASFEFTATREDDAAKVITVKGTFNQAPLVKK